MTLWANSHQLLILFSARPGRGITEIDTVYSCVIYIKLNKSLQTQAHIYISTVLIGFPLRWGGEGLVKMRICCMVEFRCHIPNNGHVLQGHLSWYTQLDVFSFSHFFCTTKRLKRSCELCTEYKSLVNVGLTSPSPESVCSSKGKPLPVRATCLTR